MIARAAPGRYHCPCSLGDLPKAPVQFAARGAVGILTSDRAPCRNVAGTPPGSDVRSWLGVRFTPLENQKPAVSRSAAAASTSRSPSR
jgi:hypothetical protein